jgi:Ca-activated chloride channel homolog
MLLHRPLALLALAALAGTPGLLPAQGWIEPMAPTPGWGVEKIRSAVAVSVRGRIAQVTVEEWFRNRGARLGEGMYHYPLSGEVAFGSFSLWQGDTELRGETMDADRARAVYEEIVRRKRDPALIELAGHGLIRARVFPINPGETRKITLRYTQVLDREGDAWRFRYAAGTGPGATGAARSFRLTADSADRFGAPYSPTHHLDTRRADGRLEIALADAGTTGDLDLFLPLARNTVGLSLITHRPPGDDGFFMLLLAPGSARAAGGVRRDVVGVVDVSGSMSGEKLAQAKAALEQMLGSLHEGDRFRLIAFESGVRRFAVDWTALTPENRRRAVAWVRGLETGGGTNIAAALEDAYRVPPAPGALGVVVFLTDGLPTVGEQDPERIAAWAEDHRGDARVFAFGIGYDVNTYLLDRLSERARGATEYVAPGGDIEQAVGTLVAKIASPVLTDLTLSASDGVEVYDVQPGALPDLFAGDEMVVFGRYRGPADARGTWSISVRGRRNGSAEQFRSASVGWGARTADDYISRLWASRKAGALSRELRLHGNNPEVLQALKDLALRFGILTEYTSYLVQEPGPVADGPVRDGRIQERPVVVPAAPTAQSGAGAVLQARGEARAASKSVLAGEADELDGLVRGRAGINPTRRAGGHLFIWRDSVWTDLRHPDSQRVVTVAPFSDAYFALLRALPEIEKATTLTPAVLVAGRRVSVEIAPGGRQSWHDGELANLVSDFRD